MKVTGGKGAVQFFGDEVEFPHDPPHQTLWQESFVLYILDSSNEVYGFLRISQVPNRHGAPSTAFLNIWTPDRFYKHCDDTLPFKPQWRTANSLAVGNGLCKYTFKDGKYHWKIRDKQYDVDADLVFTADHPGVNFFPPSAGKFVETLVPNHTQATGWTKGKVRIGDRTYKVNGYAWRDHSWGYRRWLNIRSHRFFPAIFEGMNFINVSMVTYDGAHVKYGIVVEGDRVRFIEGKDFEMVAFVAEDGISTCGSRTTLRLDGKTHVIEHEPIGKAAVIMTDGLCYVEGMCRVRMGDRVGVGINESSHNAQGGDQVPFVFPSSPGVLQNGVHPNTPA